MALLPLFMGLVLLGGVSGCASDAGKLGFTKVKYYHLKEEDHRAESSSIDPMIRFEREHFLHGATTIEEKRDRLGHYYTLFWRGRPGEGPVTLRFDYSQSRSGDRVFTYEEVITDVRGRNTTSFRITGEPYHRFGRVIAWQAQLLQDGRVLDTARSFLWN